MRRGLLFALLASAALSLPVQAQVPTSEVAAGLASVRDCRPPAEAKDAQVLAFDRDSLMAKLAVTVDKGDFKVVTVKLWERPQDPRPLIPVIEAARITQGKLQFYSPNFNADPEPVHDKQVFIAASLGGAHVCWASESALLKNGPTSPVTASVSSEPEPRTRVR